MEEEIRQLIIKSKQGDAGAFGKLVNHYVFRVSNLIYQMLSSARDVDDLTQEVFIKAYRNINYFRAESQFFTWLYRITVNTVWDYLRKQKHRRTTPIDDIAPIASGDTRDNTELREFMRGQIQLLPIKYRAVLILKDIEDLPYKEIAKVLQCRIGTVESRLFRARQALKERLEKTNLWREYL